MTGQDNEEWQNLTRRIRDFFIDKQKILKPVITFTRRPLVPNFVHLRLLMAF